MKSVLDPAYLEEFGFTFDEMELISMVESYGITDPKAIRMSLGMDVRDFNAALRGIKAKGFTLEQCF